MVCFLKHRVAHSKFKTALNYFLFYGLTLFHATSVVSIEHTRQADCLLPQKQYNRQFRHFLRCLPTDLVDEQGSDQLLIRMIKSL